MSWLLGSAGMLALATSIPIAWIVVVTLIFGITLGTSARSWRTRWYGTGWRQWPRSKATSALFILFDRSVDAP